MSITISGTTGITVASWTTATRPASPVAGQTGLNTTTSQMETYDGTQWEIYTAATSQGTSGQYLQSAGAGAAPTWVTLSVSPSGLLIRAPQILTSGTSYTTPSNCTSIYVEAVGGGGGADGAAGFAPGAGAGGYTAKYFTVTGSTAYTYAIGSGGSGGLGNPTNGGSTTFTVGATTITAGGGTKSGPVSGTWSPGSAGGVGSNGDLNLQGGRGLPASATNQPGVGGSSVWGGGGAPSTSGVGGSGGNYGGGGGGSNVNSGGSGKQGVIRIWEFT